jgi:hypothetical protein
VVVLVVSLLAVSALPAPAVAEIPVARVEHVPLEVADGAIVRTNVTPFDLIGLSWSGAGTAEMRVHHPQRGWTSWQEMELEPEEGPDPVTGESAPRSTAPVWVDGADGFAVRGSGAVTNARLHLVRERTERRLVGAVARGFGIHLRSEWGARPPKDAPSYSSIKAAVIHHTVNSNSYSSADVPGILRGIQAYHMDANGWDDIAYNFLVDRFGRAWEGRAGGIDRPVIGGHTLGFNTGTVGIAAIGDFTTADPPAGLVSTITDLVGWKLALSGVDPTATTVLTNRSPSHPRYALGENVRVRTVFAHRDTSPTGCPGTRLYLQVPSVRDQASQRYPYVLGSLDGTGFGPGGARVRGWTIARGTVEPLSVHVIVDGVYAAADLANKSRPDIAAAFPSYGSAHGYDLVAPASPGPHTICVFGINDGDGRNYLLGCSSVVVPANPIGSLDDVVRAPGSLQTRGWALDPNTAEPIPVDFYVNGVNVGRVVASGERPDVAASYPGYGSRHGYLVNLPAPADNGLATVCANAINVGPGTANTALGCRTVSVTHEPIGSLDEVTGNRARGWAIDPDLAGPVSVDLYVDGGWGGRHTAQASRPDVGAVYPLWGSLHGFDVLLGSIVKPGSVVCAYAINQGPGASNPLLGCRRAA